MPGDFEGQSRVVGLARHYRVAAGTNGLILSLEAAHEISRLA